MAFSGSFDILLDLIDYSNQFVECFYHFDINLDKIDFNISFFGFSNLGNISRFFRWQPIFSLYSKVYVYV